MRAASGPRVVFSTEDHWRHFAEFCRWELAAGGPDPQIPLVGEMSVGCSLAERRWRGGCYIAVYNVPFAEVLWTEWPWDRIDRESAALLPWLREHWTQIVTRVERRCVRRPEWMAEFLCGFSAALLALPALLADRQTAEQRYEQLWAWS